MLDVPFTANARALGSRQADAVQRITASFDLRRMANGDSLVGNAGTFGAMAFAATGGGVSTTMDLATSAATLGDNRISLDSGRVARSANETRGVNIAYHPRIHA